MTECVHQNHIVDINDNTSFMFFGSVISIFKLIFPLQTLFTDTKVMNWNLIWLVSILLLLMHSED